LTSLEVSRQRHPDDKAIQRSYVVADRMRETLQRLIALLQV
jgi:hypothetical protein